MFLFHLVLHKKLKFAKLNFLTSWLLRVIVQAMYWVFDMCFCVLGVSGWWSPYGLVNNLLMQFFTLFTSKEVSRNHFLDIVTIDNDHPSYERML